MTYRAYYNGVTDLIGINYSYRSELIKTIHHIVVFETRTVNLFTEQLIDNIFRDFCKILTKLIFYKSMRFVKLQVSITLLGNLRS